MSAFSAAVKAHQRFDDLLKAVGNAIAAFPNQPAEVAHLVLADLRGPLFEKNGDAPTRMFCPIAVVHDVNPNLWNWSGRYVGPPASVQMGLFLM